MFETTKEHDGITTVTMKSFVIWTELGTKSNLSYFLIFELDQAENSYRGQFWCLAHTEMKFS